MSKRVKVKYFTTFRNYTGTKKETINANNIKQLIKKIRKKHPEIKGKILKNNKETRNGIIIMINGINIKHLKGLNSNINENDRISIFPPVAGG